MEFPKDSLNNPQVNISYKNNKPINIKPRNLYYWSYKDIKKKMLLVIKYYQQEKEKINDEKESTVKAHNEKSGIERKDWDWYEKMDAIFGTSENIAPSFIVNRSTDIDGKESSDTIAMAISTMSETRERVWEKKLELEKERIEKNHTIEMGKLEFEREKMKMEYELKLKEMEFKQSNNTS
ncbi:unnamed protein product [Rhizophagus irregularis]|nr:unnamed protein product [Rhizophagus irregularis]